MELRDLGFDLWFQEKQAASPRPDCRIARVTAVNRESYLVCDARGEVLAELAGSFLFSAESSMDFPSVGDWAFVQYYDSDTRGIIHGLFPRKSLLRRKTPGKRVDYQMIAANIDTALILQSCDRDFNVRRLERYLVMVREGGIEPVLLLTKSDLVSQENVEKRMANVGSSNPACKVIALSNTTGFGLERVRQLLKAGQTYCLLGSSGVGKTTLLNRLTGRDLFVTCAVREKDGRGRHATARRQLIVLPQGALLVDTPGMRELGNIGARGGIDEIFSDVRDLARGCRFADCTHTAEDDCAVRAALAKGELDGERYQGYLKLRKESAYHEMSYAARRQKDRKFGRFIKSAMKHHKKK